MKIGVLGCGLMGKEAARDLTESDKVSEVGIADIDFSRVKQVCEQLRSSKLVPHRVNASNQNQLKKFINKYECIINALYYSFNETVAKTAIETGVHYVDLGGHIGHITERVLALNDKAAKAGVTIIPDLGVAPGLINILAGYGAGKLDEVKVIKLYVGGIPVKPEPPLEYNHVFSMEGLLDHYTQPVEIIRNGKIVVIPSLSEIETIYFEKFGPLEAFHTSGGTSTLSRSFPRLETLEYKTIRYPGHAKKFKLLVDLNLTKPDYEVEVDGHKVNPRKVLLKVLQPLTALKDKDDVVLLRVIVSGVKNKEQKTFVYEMITYKDRKKNVTAMERATANTVSVAAQMIASGIIKRRGVFPPEQIVPGELYIKMMKMRGVNITEKMNRKS